MTKLYDNITEWLCRRYLTKQNINQTQMRKKKVYDQCAKELQFLETLAFNAMECNEIILPSILLEQTEHETNWSLEDHPEILNFGILKSYDDKPTGNQNQAEKQYYFIHLSFQEYFAARHLLQILKGAEKQKATDFINNQKYNRRFLYVFIFASGCLAQSEYQSCMDVFWATIQGEPLDLVGLKHIKLVIECLDQLAGQTIFSQCAGYFKLVSQWLNISLNVEASVVTENLLQSLARANSLSNNSILQNKIVELFDIPDPIKRCKICYVISQLSIWEPTPKLLSTLRIALQDHDSKVRKYACQALGKMGEKAATHEAIVALINAIGDRERQVRKYACDALATMGEKAATNAVIAALINAMHDGDPNVRQYACEALGKMGKKAATNEVIAALINALPDKDRQVSKNACDALATMAEKAATNEVLTALINAIHDGDSDGRQYACEALRNMGAKAATNEVIAALINALRDSDSLARRSACDALATISEKAATNEAIAALINKMRDGDSGIRRYACEALGKIGEKGATNEVIVALINAIRDGDSDVTRYVCEALGKMGEKPSTNEVIVALINAIHDGDLDVRQYACEALGSMRGKAATNEANAALINAMRDGDSGVRRYACEALGKIGEKAATNEVIAALINAIRDGDSYVRRYACEALGEMVEKAATNEVIAALINAFGDDDSYFRGYACKALGKIGEKAVTNEVIVALVKAFTDKLIGENNDEIGLALEKAICPYPVIKDLDSKILSLVYLCIKQNVKITLKMLPSDQLIKVFLETENEGWLPLITYTALVQEIAITTVGNKIVIYNMNEVLQLPVPRPELMSTLVKAFSSQQREFENNSFASRETGSKMSG
jgi:HEAT repeat protein